MGVILNRIEQEYIFRTLKDDQTLLYIKGEDYQFSGTICSIYEKELKIEIKSGNHIYMNVNDSIEVLYNFQSNNLAFSSKILKFHQNFVFISHPEEVIKNSHRAFRRIQLNEQSLIYFQLSQKKFKLNFPKIKNSLINTELTISKDFNISNLKGLLSSFKRKIKNTVSDHNIVLLKNKNPSEFEELLMQKTCRIIWIPFTDQSLPKNNPFENSKILTQRDYFEFEIKSGTSSYKLESNLRNFMFNKKINKINSELYVPIFFKDYMVGYIYLVNKGEYKHSISKELVEYTHQFSKVLSYSLNDNGYFENSYTEEESQYSAPIIDISASGLLFTHNSESLNKQLSIFKELNINIHIDDKKILLKSWVIRKFTNNKRYYYGIQFKTIDEHDFCMLYEFLYKESFKPKGKYIW